jgi:hypothetical protein
MRARAVTATVQAINFYSQRSIAQTKPLRSRQRKAKTQQSLFTCATKTPPIDAGECSGDEIKKRATLTNVCLAIQVM